MEFCPKCKSIMRPTKKGKKTVLGCTCGYTKDEQAKPIVETVKAPEELEVVSEDDETHPITEEECPECGNKEAYFWLQQTRAGDEPETKFLKCTKCKHTWRDYS